jgi:ribosomal protein S18 acetylase RimI-like enzyme
MTDRPAPAAGGEALLHPATLADAPRVGEILAIYVHPAHQRTGLGRALLDAAITELTRRGMTEVRLWVLAENGPAQRFYERHGFAPDGARDTYLVRRPDGTAVDLPEVRYARRLAAT